MSHSQINRQRSGIARVLSAAVLFPLFAAMALVLATGCQQPTGPGLETAQSASALTAAERTHTARANVYAERVARYRTAAAAQREQAAAYARSAPRPAETVRTNWNNKLKASHEVRAAAAEQIAANLTVLADFHRAQATREVGR